MGIFALESRWTLLNLAIRWQMAWTWVLFLRLKNLLQCWRILWNCWRKSLLLRNASLLWWFLFLCWKSLAQDACLAKSLYHWGNTEIYGCSPLLHATAGCRSLEFHNRQVNAYKHLVQLNQAPAETGVCDQNHELWTWSPVLRWMDIGELERYRKALRSHVNLELFYTNYLNAICCWQNGNFCKQQIAKFAINDFSKDHVLILWLLKTIKGKYIWA